MSRTSRAAVVIAPGELQIRDVEVPPTTTETGLLRVEATGICGTDVRDLPRADLPPRIMGHEIVGVVEELGDEAATRWGVSTGDRVLLEEYLPCGTCHWCRSDDFRLCEQTDILTNSRPLRYGATPLAEGSGLWGGYSQYVSLHPQTVLHHVPDSVPAHDVPLALPISNGYEWAYRAGRVGPDDAVVIIGPGQQGLGCLLAAKTAGGGPIIVAGLDKDSDRLALAGKLGADLTVNVEATGLTAAVADATGGRMASVAIDAAAGSQATVAAALDVLGKGGRLVLGARLDTPINVNFGIIRNKTLTVTGVRGHSFEAVEWALAALRRRPEHARLLASGMYPLDRVGEAIAATGNGDAVHVSVDPWK